MLQQSAQELCVVVSDEDSSAVGEIDQEGLGLAPSQIQHHRFIRLLDKAFHRDTIKIVAIEDRFEPL